MKTRDKLFLGLAFLMAVVTSLYAVGILYVGTFQSGSGTSTFNSDGSLTLGTTTPIGNGNIAATGTGTFGGNVQWGAVANFLNAANGAVSTDGGNMFSDGSGNFTAQSMTIALGSAGLITAGTGGIKLGGVTKTAWPAGSLTTINVDAAGVIASWANPTTTPTPTFASSIQTLGANANANSVWGNNSASPGAAAWQSAPSVSGANITAQTVPANSVSAGAGGIGSQLTITGPGVVGWQADTSATIFSTISYSNFVLNTVYTNQSGATEIVNGMALLTPATVAVSGNVSLSLMVSNSGAGGYALVGGVSNQTTIAVSLSLTNTFPFLAVIPTNASWFLSNSCVGTGNSASLVAGTGQLTILGNAAASGYASLGGNNTWTGNNNFGANSIIGNGAGLTNLQATNIVNSTGFRTNGFLATTATNIFFLYGTNMLVTNPISPPVGTLVTYIVKNPFGSATITNQSVSVSNTIPGIGSSNIVTLGGWNSPSNEITLCWDGQNW